VVSGQWSVVEAETFGLFSGSFSVPFFCCMCKYARNNYTE